MDLVKQNIYAYVCIGVKQGRETPPQALFGPASAAIWKGRKTPLHPVCYARYWYQRYLFMYARAWRPSLCVFWPPYPAGRGGWRTYNL